MPVRFAAKTVAVNAVIRVQRKTSFVMIASMTATKMDNRGLSGSPARNEP